MTFALKRLSNKSPQEPDVIERADLLLTPNRKNLNPQRLSTKGTTMFSQKSMRGIAAAFLFFAVLPGVHAEPVQAEPVQAEPAHRALQVPLRARQRSVSS
jgi:hypothetical protein